MGLASRPRSGKVPVSCSRWVSRVAAFLAHWGCIFRGSKVHGADSTSLTLLGLDPSVEFGWAAMKLGVSAHRTSYQHWRGKYHTYPLIGLRWYILWFCIQLYKAFQWVRGVADIRSRVVSRLISISGK